MIVLGPMRRPRRRTTSCRPGGARGADPRRRPAAGGRPPGRAAAGAGRSRHRQDHDARRGDRRPHRGGRQPRPGPGADVLPQGGRAAARPRHRAGRPDHVDGAELDVPLLRLRPDPALRPGRALRRAAAAAAAPRSRTSCCASCSPTTPSRSPGPSRCGRALGTRGFAREVHAVLARAREKGLDGRQLRELGEREGLPELRRGRALPRPVPHHPRPPGRHRLRRPDPAGRRSRPRPTATSCARGSGTSSSTSTRTPTPARSRCSGRSPATAATSSWSATPHQSIYGFRGAEVRGILEFPTRVPPRRRASRRRGRAADHPSVRPAAARWPPSGSPAAWPLPGTIPLEARAGVPRAAWPRPGAWATGRVSVRTFDTERAEAEHLADLLRRAHLEDGVPWDEMAVLVRSGRTSIPPLRRALGAAGVPVEVASDELPLVRDPAVLPLLDALRAVVNLDDDDADHRRPRRRRPGRGAAAQPARRPRRRRPPAPRPACCGPGRRTAARSEERPPRRPGELVRRAVVERRVPRRPRRVAEAGRARALTRPAPDGPGPARRAGRPPRRCSGRSGPAPAGPSGCAASVELGGGTARRAHRDLDAVCALFDVAARAEEQRDHIGVRAFLATLRRPADPRRHPRRAGRPRRRRAPAHRPPGQGPRVAARRRRPRPAGGLARPAPPLDAAAGRPDRSRTRWCRRSRRASCSPRSAGCSTSPAPAPGSGWSSPRCASPDDDGEQPSRFLDELGAVSVEHVVGRPPRPLSLAGLVAELRRTVADPATSRAAARRRGPAAGPAGGRVGRHRARWSPRPTRRPGGAPAPPPAPCSRCATADQPVPVSASMLESLARLPDPVVPRARGRRRRPRPPVGQPGRSVVHALADAGRDRRARGRPRRRRRLMAPRRRGLGPARFRTPWSKRREHERVRAALGRFLHWHHANPRPAASAPSRLHARGRARRRRAGRASPATPTGSSSTPTARSSSSTSRPASTRARRGRPCTSTSSSGSTSTPSTAAPSTSSPAGPPRPAAPSWSSSGSRTTRRGRQGAAPGRAAPTTARSAPPLERSGWRARPLSCAPRPSRPWPASTAATATSSRSARSRARGR